MKGTCFLKVHQSRWKKILNKEVFLVLKNYLFLGVGADNSSHQLYDHALIKMDGVSNFISTAFFLCP